MQFRESICTHSMVIEVFEVAVWPAPSVTVSTKEHVMFDRIPVVSMVSDAEGPAVMTGACPVRFLAVELGQCRVQIDLKQCRER